LPHIWLPIRSNPSPWKPKKPDVEKAVKDQGATFIGLYCETAKPAQAYVLAEVGSDADGAKVSKALEAHGTPGRIVHLDEV
jgi:hypothetical protein